MIKDNKSLIIKKETIFKKFINFFRNIFKKEKHNVQNDLKNIYNYNNSYEKYKFSADENIFLDYDLSEIITNPEFYNDFKEYNYEDNINYNLEKAYFFNLYKNIKSGIIKLDALKNTDLIKINQMLKEEVKLKIQ